MSLSENAAADPNLPPEKARTAGEAVLLSCSVLSLLVSCVILSARKQATMDEVMTWKEASDRSLWHLYWAIQHGADGGQPLFYTTVWLWRHIFGGGVLTLRLYSCAAVCGALLITWKTIGRYYGVWATAIGTMMIWGTSTTVLDQNAEARFYGLYMLATAVAVYFYCRLAEQKDPSRRLLAGALLAQAALVLTHVLGLICASLILLAQILSDAGKGRFRPKVYLCYPAGWLALLVWIPAIRASMAVGKPRGWIPMPTLHVVVDAYAFNSNLEWVSILSNRIHGAAFQAIHHLASSLILIPCVIVVAMFLWRNLAPGRPRGGTPRADLLLVACALLFMPIALFLLSHLVTPVFVDRYLLPGSIGMAIVLAAFADLLGADRRSLSKTLRAAWALLTIALLLSPIGLAFVMRTPFAFISYLDVARLENDIPPGSVLVTDTAEDFLRLMRNGHRPKSETYFLLDWPTTLSTTNNVAYHLMSAYRDAGYYAQSIQNQNSFLCSHTDFYVLDFYAPASVSPGKDWFDVVIRQAPQFAWRTIDVLHAPESTRTIFLVHRMGPLPFCHRP